MLAHQPQATYGVPQAPSGGYADASIARLFEMTSDLLATISHEGRFTLLNPAWEKVLGGPERSSGRLPSRSSCTRTTTS